jgi:hypothetical protein
MPTIGRHAPFWYLLDRMPWAKILGCRVGSEIDYLTSKPRETVIIKFGLLPRFEAIAEFYAYLAYPDHSLQGPPTSGAGLDREKVDALAAFSVWWDSFQRP